MNHHWTVFVKKSIDINCLPASIRSRLIALINNIEKSGPVRGNWPNYSKLGKNTHHCHLKKRGKPTYVAVWEVRDRTVRVVDVTYVGTRENAPY
jgi:hypothetical protein